jgi:hypothetical protein
MVTSCAALPTTGTLIATSMPSDDVQVVGP